MERWPAEARPQRHVNQPSFSSTLLDAIYNSMEEPNPRTTKSTTTTAKKPHDGLSCYYAKSSSVASHQARAPPSTHATLSCSSDRFSYGGLSSSDNEFSCRRLRPIRTSSLPGAPPPEKKATKLAAPDRGTLKEPRKPASPGARLTSLLNAIFSGRRRQPPPPAVEPACSTAPSFSRSCLSKTPSTRWPARRTVRFLASDGEEAAPARRRLPAVALEVLLRRMETKSSDAGSDLFKLGNYEAIAPADGGGRAGAYTDELPVYETAKVGLNRVVSQGRAHGYGLGRSCRFV